MIRELVSQMNRSIIYSRSFPSRLSHGSIRAYLIRSAGCTDSTFSHTYDGAPANAGLSLTPLYYPLHRSTAIRKINTA
jgi:hypothetical protein